MDVFPAPSPFILSLCQTFKIKWQCQQRDCCCLMSFNWVADWRLTPCSDRLIARSAEALQHILGGNNYCLGFFPLNWDASFLASAWARWYYCKDFCNKWVDVFQNQRSLWPPIWDMPIFSSMCMQNVEKSSNKTQGPHRMFSVMWHRAAAPAVCSSEVPTSMVTNGPGGKNLCLEFFLIWLRSLLRKCSSTAPAWGDWDWLQLAPCEGVTAVWGRRGSRSGAEVCAFVVAHCCSCL